MSTIDYQQTFKCPTCGKIGAIYVVKMDGSQIVIKQRCPEHGGRAFKIPFLDKNLSIDFIRDGIFRCFKCGLESQAYRIDFNGPWVILQSYCPSHKDKIKTQKIWGSIYVEAASLQHTRISSSLNQNQVTPKQKVPDVDFSTLEAPKKNFSKKDKAVMNTEENIETQKTILVCPNCGSSLEGKEKFCGTCGAEMNT
ncbi:MAG: hypothetical protein BAJALOKI1v1_630003 [Promethearchaeota archaeon]|nr:MAG: hypothetical protein BAJALOKI1v1_630003 [Candidatus Lokiarchaeota archaeon]